MAEKILIADDEPHMLRLIEVSLRKGEFELTKAANGIEAVEIAAKEHPSLIVMDMVMPGLDGLGALSRLKADEATRSIPIIILTARGHVMARQESEQSGAEMFLTKPFSPTELLTHARRIIESKRPK